MEKSFKVKKGSPLYNKYFAKKEECEKFVNLAEEFIKKYNIKCNINKGFPLSKRLILCLDKEYFETIKNQLSNSCWHGDSQFKLNSKLNKAWLDEVYSKINIKLIDNIRYWYHQYSNMINCYHALWDFNNEVYGCLRSIYNEDIEIHKDLEEIKMSEYYLIIEKRKECDTTIKN